VEESDGTVTIAGQVPTYYFKQMAQETIMPLLDGRELINCVNVVPEKASV
jgi:hypothetical protein